MTCEITGKKNCQDRKCELHFMDAPIRLAPAPTSIVRLHSLMALALYVACIPAANWLVVHVAPQPVGFGQLAPAGVFVVGVAFTARDLLQRWAGKRWALVGIVAGTLLSLLLASPQLALASAAAFGASELLDMAVFTPLHRRGHFVGGVVASNIVAAAVDSLVFLWLAFGSLAFLPGQVLGKLEMTALALAVLTVARGRERRSAA